MSPLSQQRERQSHGKEIDEAGWCREGRRHCNLEQMGKQIAVQLCHLPQTRYTVVSEVYFPIWAERRLRVCVCVCVLCEIRREVTF